MRPDGGGPPESRAASFASASVRKTVRRSTAAPPKASFRASSCVRKTLAVAGEAARRSHAARSAFRDLKKIAKAYVPLVDAGRGGVSSLLPVDFDGDRVDRFEDHADREELHVVLGITRISRWNLRLRVVALVAREGRQRSVRAGREGEDVEASLQVPAPLAATDRILPFQPVGLVDRVGIGDCR